MTRTLLLVFWLMSAPFAVSRTWNILTGTVNNWVLGVETIASSSIGLILYILALICYEAREELQEPLIDEEAKTTETAENNDGNQEVLRKVIASVFYIIEKSREFDTRRIDQLTDINIKERKVWEVNYMDLKKTKFPAVDSNLLPCRVTAYMPEVFSSVCAKDSINKSEIMEYYIYRSLISMYSDPNLLLNQQNYSHKFLFKIISDCQLNHCIDCMPQIYNHTLMASRNNSLINRTIGVYRVKDKHQELNVVMVENIIFSEISCTLFELNGSKLVRQALTEAATEKISKKVRVVLNDVDFMQTQNYLALSFPISNELLRIIKDDLNLLESIGTVGYSFLVAVMENCRRGGITNRFTRHYFDGMGKKTYAISIINTFNGIDMTNTDKMKKIRGEKRYSDKFLNLINSIIQCESL